MITGKTPAAEPAPDALDLMFVPKRPAIWPWVVAVAVVVAAIVAGVKTFGPETEAKAGADPKTKSSVRGVLPLVESKVPQERGPLIAAVLVELLADRVPSAVRVGLRDIGDTSPEHRNLLWMKMLSKPAVRKLTRRVCSRANDALVEVLGEGRRDRGRIMYQRCDFHELALLEATQALEGGAAEMLLAHALYGHLEEEGTLTDLDTRALRLLARSSSERFDAAPPRMQAPSVSSRDRVPRYDAYDDEPPPPAPDAYDEPPRARDVFDDEPPPPPRRVRFEPLTE